MWIRGMVACAALMALTACGGGRPAETVTSARAPAYSPGALAFARGPIATACRASDRNRATRAHCGCVQAVANQRLSASDQRRGGGLLQGSASGTGDPAIGQRVERGLLAALEGLRNGGCADLPLEARQRSLIQNCRGFCVSAVPSMSFQANWATTFSRGA